VTLTASCLTLIAPPCDANRFLADSYRFLADSNRLLADANRLLADSNRFTAQRIKSLCAKLNRPALHALTLGFVHPITRKPLSFQTDPPEDFVTLVEALRQPPDWSKDDIKAALGYSDE
jgi:hypothetical protein